MLRYRLILLCNRFLGYLRGIETRSNWEIRQGQVWFLGYLRGIETRSNWEIRQGQVWF